MSHKRLWVSAAIIALVILIGFAFSVPHTRDTGTASLSQSSAASVPSVSLHDSFKKGLHTITGSLEAPNACSTVTAETTLGGEASSTNSIVVKLSLPKDSGVCLQVPTPVNFTTTVSAPAHLPITVLVNGATATTTVL